MPTLDMTVNLKPDDVKEAIRQYIQNELGVFTCLEDIHLDVERTFEDSPCGGEGLPIFTGASVKVTRGK